MRIATLGISHETNTFSTIPATYEEFEKKVIKRKHEIIQHFEKSKKFWSKANSYGGRRNGKFTSGIKPLDHEVRFYSIP